MASSLGNSLTWFGRVAVSVIVVYVIANGLTFNPYLESDPIFPWVGGLFAGLSCMTMLYVIGKK